MTCLRILLGALVAMVLVACVTTRLTVGERLNRNKCGSCHARPQPGQRERAAWHEVLEAHQQRIALTPGQRRRLLDHLSSAGGAAKR